MAMGASSLEDPNKSVTSGILSLDFTFTIEGVLSVNKEN